MNNDTIAAIATPLGEGAIGIVRISGKDAIPIADSLFSSPKNKKLADTGTHRLIYGFIKDPATDKKVDEVLIAIMKAPLTYTREDIVEINCHGGILPLRKILELVLKSGARLAEPGEFTKRAFLNGRIDLPQAEAVIDVIRARTEVSGRVALGQLSGGLSGEITSLRDRLTTVCVHIEVYIDFPEEDIDPTSMETLLSEVEALKGSLSLLSESFEEGRFFRDGLKVAIIGRPNVGKSSLLNALLKRDRAIVTEMPGTTRDVLEECLNIKGLPVRIMDTAGIREALDLPEREGVMRSLRALEEADLIIGLIDGSVPLHAEDAEILSRVKDCKALIAINKSDLAAAEKEAEAKLISYSANIVRISAKTGIGLDMLKDKLLEIAFKKGQGVRGEGQVKGNKLSFSENNGVIVTNIRHKDAIDKALDALKRASDVLESGQPLEIIAFEMHDALDRLGEIVGAVTTEDILNRIFSEFCIGK